MDINFSIDADAGEIYGVIDGSLTFTVTKDDDHYSYRNLNKLDDDSLQDKLKTVCRILLSIED